MTRLSIVESALDWLLTNYPGVIATAFLCYVTYLLTNFYGRFKRTEKQCDDLRNSYIPDLHNRFSKVEQKAGLILATVNKIATYLITKSNLEAGFFAANSPLELTPAGLKVLEASGGKTFIDSELLLLMKLLEGKAPKSGLDVQNHANLILTELSPDDKFLHIKNFVFQNPSYKVSDDKYVNLDLATIIQIMGIYLRNKYFEKYPDLKDGM